jgi:hypothetical protein
MPEDVDTQEPVDVYVRARLIADARKKQQSVPMTPAEQA